MLLQNKRFFVVKENKSSKIVEYNGLKIQMHPEVYEPAEDTFQILEIINIDKSCRVLEIGTGTGIIALECMRRGGFVVCSDVNPFAVELVKKNYEQNKSILSGSLDVRLGDLFNVVKDDEIFDVVIFNPPYLPTTKDDLVGGLGWFDIAVDGGISGLDVTERFIKKLPGFLGKNGYGLLVFSSLSNRLKLEEIIKNAGFKAKVVLSRLYDDEHIDVYRISFS